MSKTDLETFFTNILEKIKKDDLTIKERYTILQFIIDFKSENEIKNNIEKEENCKLKISPSLFQIISAGTLFYNCITENLNSDIDYSQLEKDE
jgi:hypothetical protein